MTTGGATIGNVREYVYDFELDDGEQAKFAWKIQTEVDKLGGCVISSNHRNGITRITVGFPDRETLEQYIEDYYADGGLDEEEIRREKLLIQET